MDFQHHGFVNQVSVRLILPPGWQRFGLLLKALQQLGGGQIVGGRQQAEGTLVLIPNPGAAGQPEKKEPWRITKKIDGMVGNNHEESSLQILRFLEELMIGWVHFFELLLFQVERKMILLNEHDGWV